MVTERNHGLQDPEDGLVVSEEVLPQGYVLLTLAPLQETLSMFVKPGLIPSGDIVDLGFLGRNKVLLKISTAKEQLIYRYSCCFDIVS